MATPAPSQRLASNSASVPPLSTGSRAGNWRTGEPGSTFRGIGRARGGGPRGGGSGSRSGRGIPKSGKGVVDPSPEKSETVKREAPVTIPAPLPPLVDKQSTPSTSAPARTKGSSRRSSRAVPSLVIDPSSPSTGTPPTTATSRPPNRRRRSQQTAKTPTTAAPIRVPAIDDGLLRPQRARDNLPAPPHSAPAKDPPPHMVASLDVNRNIDALVERVRASAMAEKHRPSTPGSHIDWAGDDDDSLPDLDDWGVTTSTSAGDKRELISPILVEGLKTLPDPHEKSLTPLPTTQDLPIALHPESNGYDAEQTAALVISHTESKTPSLHALHVNQDQPQTSTSREVAKANETDKTTPNTKPQTTNAELKLSLHPSLPPKPVSTPADAHIALSKSRSGLASMRANSPLKRVPPNVEIFSSRSLDSLTAGLATTRNSEVADAAGDPLAPAEEGIQASIHAPASAKLDQPEGEQPLDETPREGLAASIHAPKLLLDLSASPSEPANNSTSTTPRPFNPTHNRAQTVGRSLALQQPHTTSTLYFSERLPRSEFSNPRDLRSNKHARTHSTPPVGHAINHRAHVTRPVITGDAISRLARTIGAAGLSPSRAAVVSASKD